MNTKELNSAEIKGLFKAIAAIKTEAECRDFMRDLCTRAELKAMAERWRVAGLLRRGLPYRKISKSTGSSTATITRVASWLHHGMGGYKLMLERLGLNHRHQAIH